MHGNSSISNSKGLKSIEFPSSLLYSTDTNNKPLSLIIDLFLNSSTIYLKLGYFSSSALFALSCCFAQFIKRGGTLRVVCNKHLTREDIKLLNSSFSNSVSDRDEAVEKLLLATKEHFYQCLKFLLINKRLEIIPIDSPKEGLVHFKEGIAEDIYDNKAFFTGSMNFTFSGLFKNGESITVSRSWGYPPELTRIEENSEIFDSIFTKSNPSYKYLSNEELLNVINSVEYKSCEKLLEEEAKLINGISKVSKEHIPKLGQVYIDICHDIGIPCFPYPTGPRKYQKDAYLNWKKNNDSGIFSMATGTGKTITSLNCLLREYETNGYYHNLIVVPTTVLLDQWEEELLKFNFHEKIIKVPSTKKWHHTLRDYCRAINAGLSFNFSILITYASFSNSKFQSVLAKLPDDLCIVFDEAHNIGSPSVRKTLPSIKQRKKIALSATPNRKYDPEGTEEMESFFNDKAPYCYSFSTQRAIEEGYLTKYEYFPYIINLSDSESEEYYELSKRILRHFDSDSGSIKMTEEAKKLLLLRKNIIHKAQSKIDILDKILQDEKSRSNNNEIAYTFLYSPEGYYKNESDTNSRIIQEFVNKIRQNFPELNIEQYTSESSEKERLLDDFENGFIDILASMKCLDEGVDIPRTEVAIFCSSTGNPRQFIQRRGRVLRRHKDKQWARIYDMVVIPNRGLWDSKYLKMEQSLLRSELSRVFFFAKLSENPSYTYKTFEKVIIEYNLNYNFEEIES